MTAATSVSLHGARSDHLARAAVLGALGVVFGDIGTSPLYALKEAAHAASHGGLTPATVLGVLSLILWPSSSSSRSSTASSSCRQITAARAASSHSSRCSASGVHHSRRLRRPQRNDLLWLCGCVLNCADDRHLPPRAALDRGRLAMFSGVAGLHLLRSRT